MKKANNSFDEIMEWVLSAETIALAGHTNPDGDAIGACLALGGALEKAGKQVQVILEKYADKYQLIPNGHLVCAAEDATLPELFLALDCGDEGRLGDAAEFFQKAAKKINIDHHESNTCFGELNYVAAKASSTSEIVFQLLENRLPMTAAEAAGLYAGLIYDTGGFRHSSTSPETMQIAGALMGYGIPFTEIYNRFFDSRSFSELKLMGRALSNAELLFGGDVVCSQITAAEIAELGGSSKPAVNFTCVTTSAQLVEQDEILVFGPDLTELRGDSAYARIALLRVGDIESDDEDDTEQAFRAIQDMDFVKYHVFPKGYMIRTSSESNREQVRLSSAALKKGISFRAVGNDFIRQYKQNPNILAVKLIFITAPDADYAALEQEAKTVRDITMSLSKILEGMPTDCGSCNLKPICDEVEGMRELHFGKEHHTTE